MKASKFFRVIQEKCLISRCSREECFILWINTKKRNGNRKMKPYRSFWQQVQTRVESYPLILLISRGIIDGWKIISQRYSFWSRRYIIHCCCQQCFPESQTYFQRNPLRRLFVKKLRQWKTPEYGFAFELPS